MKYVAALSLLLLATPAAAQDADTVYMGIDLTAPAEPEQRTLEAEMLELLETGVDLGCLSFEPPSTFAQLPNDSDECEEYIKRLVAASEAGTPTQGSGDTLEEAQANTIRRIPLVDLARLAQAGNKQAQLELGIRFEEGRGVDQNWDYALELYTQAGRATRERNAIAVNGGSGENAGQGGSLGRRPVTMRIPGLPEARERRDALEARMEAGED